MHKFSNTESALGKFWQLSAADENYTMAAQQKFGISNLLARILSQKNVELEAIPDFLDPKLKNLLPSPYLLKDMDKAVQRIAAAIKNKENIAIYGDYDVDGASATAILTKYFRSLDVQPEIYIPDRIKEGYGLNTQALLDLKKRGNALVISVDCGITAFEPILEAKNAGLDVVVIDHHLSAEHMPVAVAVVNPNRVDDNSGLNNLCAAGVSFMLLVGLNKFLREDGFFKQNKLNEPDLLKLLDLVALGTVCDVMTLTGINRGFVSQGLKMLSNRTNPGLAEICDIAGLKNKPDVYSLGFLIGPRINAAGRIGDCSLGAKILSSNDEVFTKSTAAILNDLNKERQEIEKLALQQAVKQAEKQHEKNKHAPLILVHSADWHQGVIGIVAGRLKEMFNKPTAVISITGGIGKASARSVSGIDFGSAVANAKAAGIITIGGGHKAAAGFTINENKIGELHDFLSRQFEKPYLEYITNKNSYANLSLKVSSVNLELINEMEKLAPFGNGNSEPKIILEDAKIVKTKIVGEKHLQCFISEAGLAKNSATIKGVCFNCVDTKLGEKLEAAYMKNASILGKLRKNIWNGTENIEFLIEDIVL